MGNAYCEFLIPHANQTATHLLKKRDNPIFDFVQENEITEFLVFENSRAMEIFLHSKQYKILDYCWEAPDPYWANEKFEFDELYIKNHEKVDGHKQINN